jgi:hypothetical protein
MGGYARHLIDGTNALELATGRNSDPDRSRRQSGGEAAVDVPCDTGDECRLWTK